MVKTMTEPLSGINLQKVIGKLISFRSTKLINIATGETSQAITSFHFSVTDSNHSCDAKCSLNMEGKHHHRLQNPPSLVWTMLLVCLHFLLDGIPSPYNFMKNIPEHNFIVYFVEQLCGESLFMESSSKSSEQMCCS